MNLLAWLVTVLPLVPERKLLRHRLRHRIVDLLEISPSRDLNEVAAEHFDELPKAMKLFVKDPNSAILSLLLFEPGYCRALTELGFHDAMAEEARIREFFGQ